MKKLLRSGFGIALVALSLASCSSSDDNNGGTTTPTKPNEIKGTVKKGEKLSLDGTKVYNLTGKLVVEEGGTLTIPAGTTIIGTGGTSAYIAVAQGGQIFVEGTKDKPVVMTAAEKKRGSWGGLVICGRAPINKGETATAEVSDLTYGGKVANDNSGSIKFLRIEYSGANYNSEKEFNGLSLFGVGSGTTIQYVQAHEGSDDGFEWFGGTVSAQYLVSSNNDDDQFDWTEGWNGQENAFWFSKQSGTADKGFEADNNAKNRNADPTSNPTIKGITLLPAVDGKGTAMKLREGTKGKMFDVVIGDYETAFDVEHDETITNVNNGTLLVSNVKLISTKTKATKGKNTKGDTVDVSKVFTAGENKGAGNGTATPDWAKGWTVGL
ncbi:hypothetical protein HX017_00295 [Myroides marinus]|jgi:hypothetical protein|uniref:Lipoprotein n=1 Tax=Myroides marinus TaxID=703342 RepID=A0A1H6RLZ1_9FLAO|nr:hypothetical protein [Myroides marinus]MDR0194062.1 hypothetical protein [Myroides sp.]KUF45365.1 hypothetical protein AS361_06950 [Myroides marinus]MDM1345574.1 hypothetical protein [Myroides marinus]MDM1349163.1 hypothetical protein [Myroides marinus]MDM1352808.1 hypothetical protein [Myroides marinus]